ncbi:MAG: septation protein A [Gammaproteobacteria bacterium]
MKILFDFFPILLFFITFKLYDDPTQGVLAATLVAIVASIVQVSIVWLRQQRVETMHLVTLALIVVLGGATLLLRDEIYIKWKPTAVNWLFAAVFLASEFIGRKNLVQRMLEGSFALQGAIWKRLNTSWVVFFLLMGLSNLFVVYYFDTDTWVNFKLFGLLGLTLAFVLAQSLYLARHVKQDDSSA